jgi:hypothetical protein
MKQILSVIATMVLLNLNAMTSESPYLINVNIDTKVMAVDLSKLVGQTATVTINNIKGDEIFSEAIVVKSKSRLYNLKNLSTGTYTVIVEDENQITYQKIYVSKSSLLADAEVEEIVRPVIHAKENAWIISTSNVKYPSSVTIVDSEGNTVYSEKSKIYPTVKSYNVKKLQKDTYRVDYSVNGKIFSKNVEIK